MSAGTLISQINSDNPQLVHCGTADAVTGHIQIRCSSAGELFGPLTVRINLHGRAKTKVHKSTGQSRHIYRGRAPLFWVSSTIYDGPFRSNPGEVHRFPFSVSFPPGTQSAAAPGYWEDDARFNTGHGDPLPPTFNMSYSGFAHRFDAFTEYRLDGTVSMKGIDVKIQGLAEDTGPLVLYDQPRTPRHVAPQPTQFKSHVKLQNQHLLPESDRPTGFKQKTKAMFSSNYFPEYHFDVLTSCQQHIYIGQPLVFEIAMRTTESMCTVSESPDITLYAFTAAITARTEVRAEKQLFSSPESEGNETLFQLRGVGDLKTPFSKAADYTKTVETGAIPLIPSTFSTYNIRRRYTMEIAFTVSGAQKETRVEHRFPVVVHAPMEAGSQNVAAVASSSSAPAAEPAAALPEYERPPEYHQVLEEQVHDGMQEMSLGKGKATATT